MRSDAEGFLYPYIETNKCINCGLCEKVCPVINQAEGRLPIITLAAKNPNKQIQLSSSSGGVFTAIAEKVIKKGGVVFGVRLDETHKAVHSFTSNLEGLEEFRGSKYVQSDIGKSYIKVEEFLKVGRMVLFSGTPCQIAGLKLFLRKDYPNLLTVDLVCHGVPSPLIFKEYLTTLRPTGAVAGKNTDFLSLNKLSVLTDISFRDKRCGWEKYGFSARYAAPKGGKNSDFQRVNVESQDFYEHLGKNLYLQGFLKNLYLRPSCYCCPTKSLKSGSDITLADFWKIKQLHPEFYDFDGVSLVLVSSSKGQDFINELNLVKKEVSFDDALVGNKSIISSCKEPKQRADFWRRYTAFGVRAIEQTVKTMRPSKLLRLKIAIAKFLKG
jgi:ferredoxin